jgi:predicted  nucleic acid-binding Zn-ribbon protein
MAGTAPRHAASSNPYTVEELRGYLVGNAGMLRETHNAAYVEIAAALDQLSGEMDQYARDLERLEQRLTVLEEKMLATAHAAETAEQLLRARQELETELRSYRSKMSAPQLAMLEKQYLDRRLLERQKLPRLSLFYLR